MLGKAAPRQLIHQRRILCHGYRRDDGLWDIEATLEDTKTYSFANHDRHGIAAGEPIHLMRIRLSVDEALTVRGVAVETEAGPFHICAAIADAYAGLVGLAIGRGWRRQVLARLGGKAGCTHLTELLLGPVTTTAMQTVIAARSRREAGDGGRPAVIDTCHALAADGPIVARQWPQHHVPRPDVAADAGERAAPTGDDVSTGGDAAGNDD